MVKNTKEIFRHNLREIVKNSGKTLIEAANDCEISISFLNQLLSGKKSFSPETIDKLCNGLGCSQVDLFFDPDYTAAPEAPEISPYQNKEELIGRIAIIAATLDNDELESLLRIAQGYSSNPGGLASGKKA